jgi:beta-aspartyl-peptidase (threonine type)
MNATAAPVIAVHGGAGVIERAELTPAVERAYREALGAALAVGYALLAQGRSSLDAVVATVSAFEDDPLFNAGRGAALTAEGTAELDACVMDGATLKAGAVTLVTTVKNPVQLARLVMEKTRHVMLAGPGAEALARKHGLPIVEPSYFITERRRTALERVRRGRAAGSVADALSEADQHGTVGAVALDIRGNLAAATSTGGYNNKLAGRVGDSPIVGAGTYAQNGAAAVSCTGQGEHFMRVVAAHTVCALMEMKGLSVEQAADEVIHRRLRAVHGAGGLIALDGHGRVAMPLSTPGMYRGVMRRAGECSIDIFRG